MARLRRNTRPETPDDDEDVEDTGASSGDSYEEPSASDSELIDSDDVSSENEELEPAGDGNVEFQIEGDFDRLIGNIRDSGTASGSSILSSIWDAPLQENADEEFLDDLRAASGIGRVGKGKGKGKGKEKARTRQGPVLSHQVRALIGEGHHAYVDGDIPEAIRIMQEVIRIEPRAVSAWSVLATCYRDMNEPAKALQLSIMGAHLRHDAEEWERLAAKSRDLGFNQQALYCYGKVVSLDPSNANALWERASLAKENGDLKMARLAYLGILKRYPHDISVLNEIRHILVELSDLDLCATIFRRAFDFYTTTFPTGRALAADGTEVTGGGFTPMEIFVLADLYNTLEEYEKAIFITRSGYRWLQGRADQRFWDACDDDREYDPEGYARDDSTVRLKQGFYPLDINARHRLAIARLKLGETNEGKLHAEIILAENASDYSPLFAEIADAYFERGMFAEARPIYEILGADASTSSMHILMQAGASRRNLGDLKEALEVYEHVVDADPSNTDAKMKLAEIYEIMNEPRKALELVYQVIDARKRRPEPEAAENSFQQPHGQANTWSLFEERKQPRSKPKTPKARNRISKKDLEELERQKEQEAQRGHQRLQQLWPAMLRHEREAETEWLLEAEKLVESFRETRDLFITSTAQRGRTTRAARGGDAEEDRMASRLHLVLEGSNALRKSKTDSSGGRPVDFRGISFDDWLVLIMEYAFLLTRLDQYDMAEEVLRHVLVSFVYQSRVSQDKLRLALITIGIHQQKPTIVMEHSRKLISAYQFNNEPFRILLASLASGLPSTDLFITSTFQKQLFREMKLTDAAVKGKNIQWMAGSRRYAPVSGGKDKDVDEDVEAGGGEDEEQMREDVMEKFAKPEKPTKDNPVTVTIYGQTCNAVKSYQSALYYLLFGYEYCRIDPVICLSLAVASIGRAMQRQADNRNYLITQALGFLTQYRSLRGSADDAPFVDEVEYNFGRAFHQLGLLTHAVHHYERVLQIVDRRQTSASASEDVGVAREAAYNLSLIYVMTGATGLAQALYKRWLSI
ncbi:TPR-like protein [Rickenella mellea]|uniref:TPR-like protein n=1 Tax=Rickenella mellea TaxID=50990 RepID=A0A4Y7PYY1_9AGAM|nr:TPR-like protein [Rickenella mellea]